MRKFGYARVSTGQQSLDIQIKLLKENDVKATRIFSDKATGANFNRDGIELLKLKTEEGDVIYVPSIDRLGRDNYEMSKIIKDFTDKGVHFYFIKENLSTSDTYGEFLIEIIALVSKAERKRILERTQEGRLEAKAQGVKFGRKRSIDRDVVFSMKKARYGATDIANELNISRSAVYNILNEEN